MYVANFLLSFPVKGSREVGGSHKGIWITGVCFIFQH